MIRVSLNILQNVKTSFFFILKFELLFELVVFGCPKYGVDCVQVLFDHNVLLSSLDAFIQAFEELESEDLKA